MEIGTDRSRRLHGIGQPDVKRKLCRFGEGTQQNQQHGRNEHRFYRPVADLQDNLPDAVGSAHHIQQVEPGEHRQSAEYGNQHRLERSVARSLPAVPEGNQQEGRNAGKLPEPVEHH
ncbi:hypothetical protein D3C75_657970 [compost metagenome]